jgi:hypothetical protein
MALTTCKECGKGISPKAKACPHCGYSKPPRWGLMFLIVVAFVLLFAIIATMGSKDESEINKTSVNKAVKVERRDVVKVETRDAELQEYAQPMKARHPNWSNKTCNEIATAHKPAVGMTGEMLIELWGRPEDIHQSVSSAGKTEYWFYSGTDKVVMLENDIVTRWTEKK